jgi:hypothetical protein
MSFTMPDVDPLVRLGLLAAIGLLVGLIVLYHVRMERRGTGI